MKIDLNSENIHLNFFDYNYLKELVYKVNSFITKIDPTLNKNLKNNLKDLVVKKGRLKISDKSYDEANNILTIDMCKWDLIGVLQIASTNRIDGKSGVITNNGLGRGLNAGITEYFSRMMSSKIDYYIIETLIAETLLKLNLNTVFYSYFYSNGTNLMQFDSKMKDLMMYLDTYHDNYIKINEAIALKKDKSLIFKLQCSNFYNIYYVIETLITIINRSFIDEEKKNKIVSEFISKFNSITSFEEFRYLRDLNNGIKNKCKRKVK